MDGRPVSMDLNEGDEYLRSGGHLSSMSHLTDDRSVDR